MESRRLLPYIVGLLGLALALGSLSRGAPGGSLLFQSTWLLYLLYLGPVLVLGVLVATIIIIGMNWRDIGTGIGQGIAQKKRIRKRRSRYTLMVSLFVWLTALEILTRIPGSIFNPVTNSTISKIVGESTAPPNPFITSGVVPAVSSLIHSSWFYIAFLGLLVVSGLVLVQTIRVAITEGNESESEELALRRAEGLETVNRALDMLDDDIGNPRSRIIRCYQSMITTVGRIGAPVTSDMTARELEVAIRSTFYLDGPAVHDLTQLFEEARYSLHEITDADAAEARSCLGSISEELQVKIDVK